MKKILPVLLCIIAVSSCEVPRKRGDSSVSKNQTSEISIVSSASIWISEFTSDVTSVGSSSTSNSLTSQVSTVNSLSTSQITSVTTSSQATSVVTSQSTATSKPTSVATITATSASITSVSSSSKPGTSNNSTTHAIPSGTLPQNMKMFYAPTNEPLEFKTSLSSDDWYEFSMIDDLPSDDWTFIYGNNCSRGDYGSSPQPSFYSSNNNAPGGLKMDQRWKGFQTPLFHHNGPKLEIRLDISQVNNANDKPVTSVPTGYFFFYDKDANWLSNLDYKLVSGTITKNTDEVKFYVTGSGTENVAYFEFRLSALPYKGSQSYNFGLGGISIHSWERV